MGFTINLMLIVLTIAGLTHILKSLKSIINLPSSLQWADQHAEVLPKSRACLRQLVGGLRSLKLGYANACGPLHLWVLDF